MGTIFFLLPSAVTTSSNVVSLRSNDPSLYFPLLHTHLSHQLSLHFYISSVAPLKTQPNPPWGNKPFFFLGGVFSSVFPLSYFSFSLLYYIAWGFARHSPFVVRESHRVYSFQKKTMEWNNLARFFSLCFCLIFWWGMLRREFKEEKSCHFF